VYTNDYNFTDETLRIGSIKAAAGTSFIGAMKEIRVSNNARYSAIFSPSQNGFTVDANTKLYIKASEANGTAGTSILDSETTPKTITCVADAKIKYAEDYRSCIFVDSETTAKYPYPIVAKVDFFAIGSGVGYFDGTGDDLTAEDSDNWYFDGDFTLELWARFPAVVNTKYLIGQNQAPPGSSDHWFWSWDSSYGLYFSIKVSNSAVVEYTGGKPVALDAYTWTHLAIRRASNEYQCFINGTPGTAATDTSAMSNYTGTLHIGGVNGTSFMEKGLLDNVRIAKGVSRYIAAFNPIIAGGGGAGSGSYGRFFLVF
jgi:hypothetical protein